MRRFDIENRFMRTAANPKGGWGLSCAIGTGAVLTQLLGTAAYGQAVRTDQTIETVVVTAEKRPEDLQKVPLSMTVLSSEDLSKKGINSLRQLEFSVPNLSFVGVDTSVGPTVAIRGISSDARNIGFESGVSMYVDGVYTGRPDTFNADMLGIEQIEVLRGPQGTLFGKNTTAGALNITTRQPTDTLEGSAEFEYGTFNQVVGRGTISGPLVEGKLAAEAGGFFRFRGGYQANLFDGTRKYDENSIGGQAKFRYTPNASTDITLAFDGLAEHYRPDANQVLPGSFGYVPGQDPRAVNIDAPVFQKRQIFGTSLTANLQLEDGTTLTSISAYRLADTHFLSDDDASPEPFLTSNFVDNQNQFSQEVRLASPGEGALTYVAGVYFFAQGVNTRRASIIPPFTLLGPMGVAVTLDGSVNTRSYAAFGQAEYKFTDALRLSAGLRYTYEEKDLRMNLMGSPLFGIIDLNATRSISDSNLSPMVSLSYAFSDEVNGYAKISEGFKSGGFNADFVASSQVEFKPETVTNYEIGLKTQIADHLRLNVAAFYMDYDDLQVSSFQQFSGFVISNAAKAHIWGAEVDGVAELFPGFELTGGLGYLNATFSSYPNGGGLGIDYTGNTLPNAPHWTGNVAGEYTFKLLDWGTAFARAEYAYRDFSFTDSSNDAGHLLSGFGLFDARIGLNSPDGRWTFELWGKNLSDKLYANDRGVPILGGILGQTFVSYGAPRTAGIRVATNF